MLRIKYLLSSKMIHSFFRLLSHLGRYLNSFQTYESFNHFKKIQFDHSCLGQYLHASLLVTTVYLYVLMTALNMNFPPRLSQEVALFIWVNENKRATDRRNFNSKHKPNNNNNNAKKTCF